jgi:hypothetical protein
MLSHCTLVLTVLVRTLVLAGGCGGGAPLRLWSARHTLTDPPEKELTCAATLIHDKVPKVMHARSSCCCSLALYPCVSPRTQVGPPSAGAQDGGPAVGVAARVSSALVTFSKHGLAHGLLGLASEGGSHASAEVKADWQQSLESA